MGYYTAFDLEIENEYEINAYAKTVEILTDRGVIGHALTKGLECSGSVKWYKHEVDMKALSLQIKDALYKLSGDGEEKGDQWVKYFKNGKMQTCKAITTYPKFDKNKLE